MCQSTDQAREWRRWLNWELWNLLLDSISPGGFYTPKHLEAFGKAGCFGTISHSLSRSLFSWSVQDTPSGNDFFTLTMAREETGTGCCSATPRCCFPVAFFLDTSKQHCHQSPFVLTFAFWPIPMAWSFWHVFPHQINFSGSPTYAAVWSQAMSPGCKRGYISQKYFLLNIFNGFMDWNMCSCIFYTKNM